MLEKILPVHGVGLKVRARWGSTEHSGENGVLFVSVTNIGSKGAEVTDVEFRAMHDTELRIAELSLATRLEGGPQLPCVVGTGETVTWRVRPRDLQSLIYGYVRESVEKRSAESSGSDAEAYAKQRFLLSPGRARVLVERLRTEPGRLPTGLRVVVRRLLDRPETVVVAERRGRRFRAGKVDWGYRP